MQVRTGPARGMLSGRAEDLRLVATEGQHYPYRRAVPEPGVHAYAWTTMWFEDRFPGPDLDREVWFPHYLPAWSSRAATAASYRVDADGLTLDIPLDHPRLVPGHPPRRCVSPAIQSGSWSGPLGSSLRPAALRRRPDRARGAGAVRGLAAERRPGRDLGADVALAPLDGRALDERLRGRRRAAPVRRAVRVRDLRQGPWPGRRPLRRGRRRDQGVPRPRAHPGLRRSPAADRRARAAPVRRRVGRRRGGLQRRRRRSSGAARARRPTRSS